jgi:hypothetical protein
MAPITWGSGLLDPTLEFDQARAGWFPCVPRVSPLFRVHPYDWERTTAWRATMQGMEIARALLALEPCRGSLVIQAAEVRLFAVLA